MQPGCMLFQCITYHPMLSHETDAGTVLCHLDLNRQRPQRRGVKTHSCRTETITLHQQKLSTYTVRPPFLSQCPVTAFAGQQQAHLAPLFGSRRSVSC